MLKPIHRNEFPWMLRSMGLSGTAVEVGVAEGNFARDFLDVWPGRYVMVDAWRHIPGYDDVMNGPDAEHEIRYRQAMEVAAQHKERVAVLRMDSVEAAEQVPDGSVDFVYLDGDHSFQGVMRDLNAWLRKVKSGGVIAGHDYYDRPPFAVRSAVRTFFNGPCGITHEASPSWWVLVP